VRLALVGIALAVLSGCADRDREWIKTCTTGGFSKGLCECLAEKIPAPEREKLVSFPRSSFGGGWILIPNNEEAAYCDRFVDELRSEKAR
jgi:hypothetical protein